MWIRQGGKSCLVRCDWSSGPQRSAAVSHQAGLHEDQDQTYGDVAEGVSKPVREGERHCFLTPPHFCSLLLTPPYPSSLHLTPTYPSSLLLTSPHPTSPLLTPHHLISPLHIPPHSNSLLLAPPPSFSPHLTPSHSS